MALVLISLLLVQPTTATPTGGATIVAHTANGADEPLFIDIPGATAGVASMTQTANSDYYYAINGLSPGTYSVLVTDAAGNRLVFDFVLNALPVRGCTDPGADNYDPAATEDDSSCAYTPPPRAPFFDVPLGQSLRFVRPDRADLPAYDNRLLADSVPADTEAAGYCQLVERGDTLVLQYRSNYTGANTVALRPAGGGAVLTFMPVRVMQGVGTSLLFDAYLRADVATGGTRIYFNNVALPVPFAVGQRVTLTGDVNGTFPVADVREDPAAAVPYLLLTRPYASGQQRQDVALTTPYALQVFDTWQVVLPFAAVPAGDWQAVVTVTDPDFGTATAVSEPLAVAVTHRDTVLLQYRNLDNAFDLNYTAGLVNRLRVRGRLFGRKTPTQKTTLRNSNNRLDLLSAEAQRLLPLTVYLAPGYVHEAVALAFCHDYTTVEGLRVLLEGEYEYDDTKRYTLSTATALVEQVDFLVGNRDDVGDVDGGPFLLVNDKFLKVNF